MKILLVSSHAEARRAHELAAELGRAGHAVTELAIAAGASRATLEIADALARAAAFDVVHVHGELRAVAPALVAGAAVVVTLPAVLSDADLELARMIAPRVALATEGEAPKSLVPVARIDGRKRASDYAALYESLAKSHGAARADHHHDSRPWGEYWVL